MVISRRDFRTKGAVSIQRWHEYNYKLSFVVSNNGTTAPETSLYMGECFHGDAASRMNLISTHDEKLIVPSVKRNTLVTISSYIRYRWCSLYPSQLVRRDASSS